MNVPQNYLKFDEVPQRDGQNMNIVGDNSKFNNTFKQEENNIVGISKGLLRTIHYFKERMI